MLQIRCLYEGIHVDDILENWEHILPAKMNEWKLDRSEVRKRANLPNQPKHTMLPFGLNSLLSS